MTDSEPETELEYHFQKLSRTISRSAAVLSSAVYLVGAGLTVETNLTASLIFLVASGSMVAVSHALGNDGRVRAFFNRTLGTDVSELQRPETNGSQVMADD